MFAFFWTQNSHARTPSGPNTTRNTVQKSDFPRSWLIGSAFRKPATTSATGAEQQNLLSTEGNAPAANAPNASNWGIDWLQEFWWIKDLGFGKRNLWCISMMYSSRQWPTDLIHGRFYQMAWSLCSFHILSPLPKTHPSGFKIPKDCRCSAFLKLSEVWWNF